MAKMSDIFIEIEDMLIDGESPAYIAKVLDISVNMVYDVLESLAENQANLTSSVY